MIENQENKDANLMKFKEDPRERYNKKYTKVEMNDKRVEYLIYSLFMLLAVAILIAFFL